MRASDGRESRTRRRTQIIRFGVASRGLLGSLVAEHNGGSCAQRRAVSAWALWRADVCPGCGRRVGGPGRLPGVVRSHVVTGGGRGVGRAVAERLLAVGDAVVVLDSDEAALGWTSAHLAGRRVISLAGDAADESVTGRAADLAQEAGRLAGWVNNAAVFRDAWLDAVPAAEVSA